MTHDFFGVVFNRNHYTNPFTCACDEEDLDQIQNHSLSAVQKTAAFAIPIIVSIAAMIVAGPAFGLIAIPTFYVLTAFLKTRNSVWVIYNHTCHISDRFFLFVPDWWGIPVRRRVVNPPIILTNTHIPVFQTPIRQTVYPRQDPLRTPDRRQVPGTDRSNHSHHHASPYRSDPAGGRQIPGHDARRR